MLERLARNSLVTIAILSFFYSAPSDAQELRLEITGTRNPLKDNIFPVIYGKIEDDQILLGETAYPWQTFTKKMSENPSRVPPPVARSGDLKSTNPSSQQPSSAVASFLIRNFEDQNCVTSKHVREVLSLITAMKAEITHLSLSTPRETSCSKELAQKLTSMMRLDYDADALPDRIRLRLHFAEGQAPAAATTPEIVGDAPPPDTAQTAALASKTVLTINGEVIEPSADGWFVYETATMDAHIVSIRHESKTVFIKSITPSLLKPGTTERKSANYRYIYLATNASTLKASVGPERLDLKDLVNVSIPIFLKLSYGNTRLYPLPGEGKVDRPTVLAGVKTHPFFYGMHFEADGFFSYKSGSKIPWTALMTAVMGNDLMELGNSLSVPVGIGVRAFKSKIDSGKSTAEAGGEGAAQSSATWIPESVLGPAASVGVRYRNDYIYSDATLTVTPLQVPGAKLIITWNPSFWLGYQITGADTLTLNYQTHDIRYPTATKIVKVTASILAVGYVRDLR